MKKSHRKGLLDVSRWAIEYYLERKENPSLEVIENIVKKFPIELISVIGVAVILVSHHKNSYGKIRGVHILFSTEPMVVQLVSASINAAFFDPKTPRLKRHEINEIDPHIILISQKKEGISGKDELWGAEYRGRNALILPYELEELETEEQKKTLLRLRLGLHKEPKEGDIELFGYKYEESVNKGG